MKDKRDYLKRNGYEYDSDSEYFINFKLKNIFTLDFLYDNSLGNIKKSHEESDSARIQFFADSAPDIHATEEFLRRVHF